jgi:hypothetical protein
MQKVRITPSKMEGGAWAVFDARGEMHELIGEDVEKRAFAIAVAFAEQKEH